MSLAPPDIRHPLKDDVRAIQDAIKEAQIVQVDLDHQIEKLMRQVRSLQYQKSQQDDRIRYYKGLITLASRMPAEILARIFEMTACDGWTRAPLVLGHVCSAWRTATMYPNAWSYLYVNYQSRNAFGRTLFWLERAKQVPLHITLEIGLDGAHLDALIEILLDRSEQWKSLTINSLLLSPVNLVLSKFNCKLPRLTMVTINVNLETRDGATHNELTDLHIPFKNAPNLQILHLSHELSTQPNVLPDTITTLAICLPFWSGPVTLSEDLLLNALQNLTHLRHFTLEFPQYHERNVTPSTQGLGPITLHTLESLVLKVSPEANRVLTCILAPNLRELRLISVSDPLGFPHEPTGTFLTQFLRLSLPPLEYLELHDVDIPSGVFSEILLGLPNLLDLRLHESEITDDVIRLMSGQPFACPNLQRLDLRWCEQVTGSSLVELARNRSRSSALSGATDIVLSPIEEVAVINCSFVREKDVWDMAKVTRCRVITRPVPEDDYCRQKGCCRNDRYRKRLGFKLIVSKRSTDEPVNLVV